MRLATPSAEEHAGFRALVDAEIRPGRAETHAWDDFPLVLDPANIPWTLVACDDDGTVAAGLAVLVRDFATSCGDVAVAGLGSVVTRPDRRGRGLSRALQDAMLARLARQEVPLAVLWSDRPEIYAGRGFRPAGWERHLLLADADLPGDARVRPYAAADAPAVAALYARHPWRTRRREGEAAALYGMPGTRGLVLPDADGVPVAAVFCGKGADFPGYVTEWSGPVQAVLPLLAAAAARGWADHVLCPPGSEALVDAVTARGGAWFAVPSGLWRVLAPAALAEAVRARGGEPPPDDDPAAWLGRVDDAGVPVPGALHVAVWGFDSV